MSGNRKSKYNDLVSVKEMKELESDYPTQLIYSPQQTFNETDYYGYYDDDYPSQQTFKEHKVSESDYYDEYQPAFKETESDYYGYYDDDYPQQQTFKEHKITESDYFNYDDYPQQQTFKEHKITESDSRYISQSQKKKWPIKNKDNNCLFEALVPYMYFSSDNDDAENKKQYILNQYKKYLDANNYEYNDYTRNELNLITNICDESINLMTYYNTINSDISNYIKQFKNSFITTNKNEIDLSTTALSSNIIGMYALDGNTIASSLDNTLCIINGTIEHIINTYKSCIMIAHYGVHFICLIYCDFKFYVIDSLSSKIIIYNMDNIDELINKYHIIIFKEYKDDIDITNIMNKLNQFKMITKTEQDQNELEQIKQEQKNFNWH